MLLTNIYVLILAGWIWCKKWIKLLVHICPIGIWKRQQRINRIAELLWIGGGILLLRTAWWRDFRFVTIVDNIRWRMTKCQRRLTLFTFRFAIKRKQSLVNRFAALSARPQPIGIDDFKECIRFGSVHFKSVRSNCNQMCAILLHVVLNICS